METELIGDTLKGYNDNRVFPEVRTVYITHVPIFLKVADDRSAPTWPETFIKVPGVPKSISWGFG